MTEMPSQPRPQTPSASRSADVAAFGAGALAAVLGIAVGEAAAGFVAGAPSLVVAIGDLVIENQPPGAKELVVALFGSNNKLALEVGIVAASLVLAGVLGVAGRRRFGVPVAGFLAAGLVGLVASLSRPLIDPLLAVVTLVASVGLALAALRAMLSLTAPAWRERDPVATPVTPATGEALPDAAATMPDWDRRRFLQLSGGVAIGSLALGLVGRGLLEGRPGGAPPDARLPAVAGPPSDLPAGASLAVPGLTPVVVPNADFYRIDTALIAPRVDVADWTLTVRGMVDREVRLGYDELSAMPTFEQYVTIACVSNEVGGRLVGNALWTGVDLRDVLDMAGVEAGASQVVGRSVDGWTAGFPTTWVMDPERRSMIALGMNGVPLPVEHGYPARLIVPGLYGYVSATKWLSEIELTTMDAFDAYWIPRGWAKEAPILTQSRIDVPRGGARLEAGTVAVAGVAWAPDRGISGVEVRIDDGPWQPARLSQPLSDAAWVQWSLAWEAVPGDHRITVRAIDGTGTPQTDAVTPPAPDGARGHHSVSVTVA